MLRPSRLTGASLALAVVAAVAVAGPAGAHGVRRFTFSDAAYMDGEAGMRAARAFVAEALPRGLPMREAVARVTRADMACRADREGGGAVRCRYFVTSRPEFGDLGEDIWTVRLTPGSDGLLQDATLGYTHGGLSTPSHPLHF